MALKTPCVHKMVIQTLKILQQMLCNHFLDTKRYRVKKELV